jgi:hypothetical protein
MAFNEVHDCEILISEIDRRPALYDCSLKDYSDKGLKERLWGEVCEGKDGNARHYDESQKYGVSATVCAVFYRNNLFYHRQMIIISNTKTHQQCQIFQIKEK